MTDEPHAPELHRSEPRLFGTIPALRLLYGGGLAALVGVALAASGHWVVGPLLLVVGLAGLVLYLVAARRRPHSRLRLRAVGAIWLARDEVRLASSSAWAWTLAGRRVLGLQRELRALIRERDRVQHELGGAAYREDAELTAELRSRMHELDERVASYARRMDAARRVARARVSTARLPTASTESLPVSRSPRAGSEGGRSMHPPARPSR